MLVAHADAMAALPRMESLTKEATDAHADLEAREKKAYGKATRDTPLHEDEWQQIQPLLTSAAKLAFDRTVSLDNLRLLIARLESPGEEAFRLDIAAHHMLEAE